jgi:hypothetical protein
MTPEFDAAGRNKALQGGPSGNRTDLSIASNNARCPGQGSHHFAATKLREANSNLCRVSYPTRWDSDDVES